MAGDLITGTVSNVIGSAAGGGLVVAAPHLWNAVAPFVADLRARALVAGARFEENARALVGAVAGEVSAGAGSPAEAEARLHAAAARLEDPDVAVAVADALRAGGRIPSEDRDRHATLAKVVAARLAAPGDSVQAVAANLAVRAIEALGPSHLRVLALLALAHYAGRPNPMVAPYPALPAEPPPYVPGEREAEQLAAHDAYEQAVWAAACSYAERQATRVFAATERLAPPAGIPDALTLHLEASACVLRYASDPELFHVLARPVAASGGRDNAEDDGARVFARAYRAMLDAADREAGDPLDKVAELWRTTLCQLAPTPAGLLIGLAAYDALAGEHTTAEWQWAGVAEAALTLSTYTADPPFAAWARDETFQEAIERAVAARLAHQRRVGGVSPFGR